MRAGKIMQIINTDWVKARLSDNDCLPQIKIAI